MYFFSNRTRSILIQSSNRKIKFEIVKIQHNSNQSKILQKPDLDLFIFIISIDIQMGPISPYGPKQFGRLTEQDILKESENYIKEQQLCKPTDDCFQVVRLVIAKINIYGHRHLLQHIRSFKDQQSKLRLLQQWKTINFENLDLLFQNLIRRKIMRVEDEQTFTKIQAHQKYSLNDRDQLQKIYERGENLLQSKKVAILIFAGNSATKSEQNFEKQFHKQRIEDKCLFQILMKRLEEIGNNYDLPPTYIFFNKNNSDKVNKFLQNYKYGDKISCIMQGNHPVLNLNGNICLRTKQTGDIIEMPNGAGDFYHTSVKGVSILDKLKQDNIEYVCCCDCQNMLEMVADPYMIGLLDTNKAQYDLMYKCTYPQNQKDKIFRRVVMQNGIPKADTIQALNSYINYNSKYRTQNNSNVIESPVWMNSLVFIVDKVSVILKSAQSMQTFPQTVNYKMKTMSYWSPLDFQEHNNEACYVFEKQLSDLFINHLFKSKGVMVERQQQYLPVITQTKQFSWRQAYKDYCKKYQKNGEKPFYQKIRSHDFGESVIRVEGSYNKPN